MYKHMEKSRQILYVQNDSEIEKKNVICECYKKVENNIQ